MPHRPPLQQLTLSFTLDACTLDSPSAAAASVEIATFRNADSTSLRQCFGALHLQLHD